MATLIQEKVRQAGKILDEQNIDCWITFVRESGMMGDPILPFLTTSDVTWHSAFIVTRKSGTRAIVGLYDQKTAEDTGAWDVVEGYVQSIREPLQKYLKELQPGGIALNYSMGSEICDGLTHGMYLTLIDMLSGIGMAERVAPAEKIISALRERKSPVEIDRMRSAIRATQEIFEQVRGFIRVGMTEADIAAFMLSKVAERKLVPAWEPTQCPAVFTGPETAGAHYAPTERKVERGHVLNMDFGVRFESYCSDLQRTYYVLREGETKAPPAVQRGFDVIRASIENARAAIRPGVQGNAIDTIARKTITDAGYKEFPHGLGHQVGRYAHDGTALLGPAWEKYAQKPFLPLEANMVFTIEPRLTVEGHGVVTMEEMVVVTPNGAEYLSTPQQELWYISR